MYMSLVIKSELCVETCADVNMSWSGPAKASAKSMKLCAVKVGPPVVKLFNFWHFMSKVALFHSQLCVGIYTLHKRFYVNERTSKEV